MHTTKERDQTIRAETTTIRKQQKDYENTQKTSKKTAASTFLLIHFTCQQTKRSSQKKQSGWRYKHGKTHLYDA